MNRTYIFLLALLSILLGFIPQQGTPKVAATSEQRPVHQNTSPSPSSIQDGLAWLATQQSSSGSWSTNTLGLTLRDTATAIQAFAAQQQRPPAYQRGVSWLAAQQPRTLDLEARRIAALAPAGVLPASTFDTLVAAQLLDGSWGDSSTSTQGNPFDTALVLQALADDPTAPHEAALYGLYALRESRHTDGGWMLRPDQTSLHATATIVWSIAPYTQWYNLSSVVDPAITYLWNARNSDGSFGDSSNTETALALLALASIGNQDETLLDTTRNFLLSAQQANGSWDNNVYTTALVILALSQRQQTSVYGMVVDTYNNLNSPISDASITATLDLNTVVTATTDLSGTFNLDELTAGVWNLEVTALGYDVATGSVRVIAGQATNLGTIGLNLLPTQADFVWNPQMINQFSYVTFTATAQPAHERTISSYAWSSSNGYTSGNQEVWQVYFSYAGTYTVSLTVIDNWGFQSTAVHSITVQPPQPGDPNNPPSITITQHPDGCAEGEVCAIDIAYQGDVYNSTRRWDWGDGDVDSAYGIDLNHRYDDDGVYTVTLEIMNTSGLTATDTTTVTVDNAPPTAILGSDREIFAGYGVAIPGSASDPSSVDVSAMNLSWDFGDGNQGNPTSIIHDPDVVQAATSHIWEQAGVYTVTLTARDPDGATAIDTAVYTVTTKNLPPVITSQPPIFALEAVPYTYTVQANDPESDDMSYVLSQAPFGMEIDTGGTITWTPTEFQVGFVPVTVVVSDTAGEFTAQSYQLRVFPRGQRHDLIVQELRVASSTDAQALQTSGVVTATIRNLGPITVTTPFSLTLFDDLNLDQTWSPFQDSVLGQTTVSAAIPPFATHEVVVPISGLVSFRDNVVYGVVDPTDSVDEDPQENNNITRSTQQPSRITPPSGAGTIAPELKWSFEGVGGDYHSTIVQPAVGPLIDFNADGAINKHDVPAIVGLVRSSISTDPQGTQLIILRGDTGQLICRATNLPYIDYESIPLIGDLNDDGVPEIVLTGYGYDYQLSQQINEVTVFNTNCTQRWKRSFSYEELKYCSIRSSTTEAFLVDLNQDRKTEILVGNHILDFKGNTLWHIPDSIATSTATCFAIAADIDLDGNIEYIDGAQVVFRHDGTVYWDNEQRSQRFYQGHAALGNFDTDPYAEIVFVGYYSRYGPHMELRNHDGSEIWAVPLAIQTNVAPTLGDFNLDGVPDIALTEAPKSTLNVYSGRDGSLLWSRYFYTDTGPTTTPSAFDFNGDGILEIIYRDEQYAYVLNGLDGAIIWQDSHGSSTGYEYPIAADFDADGHAEFLSIGQGGFAQGIYRLYDDRYNSWGPARNVSNQFNYFVTNVNDDGRIPQYQQPNWLRYNNYRVQVAPEGLDPYSKPDLTASFIRSDASACPDIQQLTVRVGNGGDRVAPTGWGVALYNGTPDSSTFITAVVISQTLEPGQYLDLTIPWDAPPVGEQTITVVANALAGGDLVPEDRRSNNTHSLALTVCDGTNQPPVITSTQPSSAEATKTYNPIITASDPDGDPLDFTLLEGPNTATIHSINGELFWLPSYADQGEHIFRVAVTDGRGGQAIATWVVTVVLPEPSAPGDDGCADGTPGAIEIPGNGVDDDCNAATPDLIANGAVQASITTNKAAYGSHELVRITSMLNHSVTEGTLMGLVATVRVRTSSGNVIYEQAHTVLPLAPGASQALTDVFATGTHAPGTLTAEVSVTAPNEIAQASTSFDLRASSESGTALSGTLTLVPQVVASGASFDLHWSATNVGNTNLNGTTFTLFVIDPATEQIVQQQTLTADLSQGSTIDRITRFTNVSFSGQALVVLQATTNTIDQPLDNAGMRFEGVLVTDHTVFLPIVRK